MIGPQDVLSQTRLQREALAVREIEQVWHRADPIVDAVRAGWGSERIERTFGATYREIKRARRQIAREDAARQSLMAQGMRDTGPANYTGRPPGDRANDRCSQGPCHANKERD